MKTTIKLTTLFLVVLVTIFSCSNSGANSKKKQTKKQKEITQTSEIDKQISAKLDFEEFTSGELPEGWSQFYSGKGGTDWKIIDDMGNKVLAQLYNDNPNGHFNIAVYNKIVARNMTLTARLKGVTGKHDQGGGFVWRFIDKDNYYIVRANPLEDNVVLYKVENGKRTDLPLIGRGRTYGIDVPTMGSTWHTFRLVVKDNLFTVFLNDKELFEVKDKTFVGSGKVGFWTKADAVTYFDDFKIE